MRLKNKKEENFPVGMFVEKNKHLIIDAYYRAAREADDVADAIDVIYDDKIAKLKDLERDFWEARTESSAAKLGKIFKQENLDNSLYTDLLSAFRKDCDGFKPQIWEQLLDYCRYSAAPVGRFMLALYDESTTTYLPAEGLCAVLQIVNMLQDIKFDVCKLRRCYIPKELLNKFMVCETDFCLQQSTPQVKALFLYVIERLEAMLKDAEILISLVNNRSLRVELCVIFSLTNCMLKKIKKGDVVANKIKLSKLDWFRAIISGWCKSLFVRTKTCRIIR